jgi:hypothetical protein
VCVRRDDIFCKECKHFLHTRLKLRPEYISNIIHNTVYYGHKRFDNKCTLCDSDGIISYYHPETHKYYWLCQKHLDRWLKIGCELGEFVKMLGNFGD